MKKLLFLFLFLGFYEAGVAQIGGIHAYEFLNLVSSPRVASLGGKYISSSDNDVSLVYHNPSLLNSSMHNYLSLSFVNYFADVKYGYVSYARAYKEKGSLAFGIQYINYGNFTAADPNGTITGSFTAAEYAFNVAYAQPLDSFFTIGADVRPIVSVYERYQSYGLSTDIGLTWHHVRNGQTLALVIRNFGSQIKPYYETRYESLPFEIQLGFTQKLIHAPFRFSVTAQHLETPDMSTPDYEKELQQQNTTSTDNQIVEKTKLEKLGDNVMRHFIFGVEFTPFRSFFVRAGYNYQRRQELKIDSSPGMVGFSWGLGISISRFQLSYGRASYNLAGASNHFQLATDLSSFYRKKTK